MRFTTPLLRQAFAIALLAYGGGGSASPLVDSAAGAVLVNHAEILAAHNEWRARVGIPALMHSDALATSAQAWAEHLKNGRNCQLHHSEGGAVGENLYWAGAWSHGPPQSVTSQAVVNAWGNEKYDYDAVTHRCALGKVCGHYTQLVWKNTRAVGCGMAFCASPQNQVWVCHYSPPGNFLGQVPY
jgi:pathogenesis-related protein 1